MSTSSDSEITIDNPSSDEVSREISEVIRNVPSSDDVSSVSEAAGYETASEGFAATGVCKHPSPEFQVMSREETALEGSSPSSEVTASQHSTATIPPEVSSRRIITASPDSEILVDNPSSDEVSRETSEVMRNIPSSEDVSSVSEAAGYETASEGLEATGVCKPPPPSPESRVLSRETTASEGSSPSSEEIPSQCSIPTIPPDVLAILAESPDGFIIPPEIRQCLLGKPSAVSIPPDVSGEETDDSGQRKYKEVFEKAIRSDESSPSQEMALSPDATEKVGFFKRVWLQKDPWKLHLKKYWFFFLVSYFAGIIGLVLFGLRFAPFEENMRSLEFLICSVILLEIRCILMHLVIPEGPPFTATKTGVPLYKADGTA